MSYIERLLKITDDLSEQIEIGRRLVVSYDKEMVKFIMGTFDKINDFEKRTNGISKENMLYKNVYDYWMYGFRPDQQFYCKHSIAFLSAFSIQFILLDYKKNDIYPYVRMGQYNQIENENQQ